jgi:hypothetical protein
MKKLNLALIEAAKHTVRTGALRLGAGGGLRRGAGGG